MDTPQNTDGNETYLSQEKLNELKEELEELKTNKRKEIADKLEYAKSLGDLSENAEYQEAREAQAGIEERISTIEEMLKHAVVISGHKADVVDIGSIVTLKRKEDGEEFVYEIVGSEESDIKAGKISNKSPLGGALIGKKKGDEVISKSPKGDIEYTVLKIGK